MQGINTSILKHKVFQERESVFVRQHLSIEVISKKKQKRKWIAPNAVDVYTLL